MLSPQQLANRLSEGIAHHQAGRLDRAESIYRQVAVQNPRTAVVFELLGRVAEQQGRTEETIKYFRQALALEPSSISRAVQYAGALIAVGRLPDAESPIRKITQDQPKNAEAWSALGYVLKLQAKLPEALACNQRAVELNPKFVEGWYHYGLILSVLGRNHEALDKQERALALNPRFGPALYGRAQVLHKVYRTEEAIRDYDAFLAIEPQNLEAKSYRLFALQSLDRLTPAQLFAEHCDYGRLVGRGPATLPGYDYAPDRRLRVAIHSPDLRTHSCAFFLEPLLRGLDPEKFELYLYHDHFVEDGLSARLRTYAKVWRNFVAQPPGVFERQVREDKPDILIDLTGHVGNTVRLPSFARRLAPVQITYLGYPDTTGVPAMDFRFTDGVADPVGVADAFATETLVRFAPVAWTYRPPVEAPAVMPPPSCLGAPITFGCFNSPTKFTASLFACWARILAAVPNSRLLLKGMDFEGATVRDEILSRLHAAGVAIDRIELLPRTPDTASHLAKYGLVDIALDTFPYAGTTTTCEALWMGRPVVTLAGNRHAARVGASLLHAVGHPEWVGQNQDDYVRIAVGLAVEPMALMRHAASLRRDLQASPLLDHAGQARRFGEALRACWVQVCSRLVNAA